MVILTGGHVDSGDGTTVSIYDKNGWKRDLPSLQQKRKDHGCASYNDDENNIVSMRKKYLHFFVHPVYILAIPSICSHKSGSRITKVCLSVNSSSSLTEGCFKGYHFCYFNKQSLISPIFPFPQIYWISQISKISQQIYHISQITDHHFCLFSLIYTVKTKYLL